MDLSIAKALFVTFLINSKELPVLPLHQPTFLRPVRIVLAIVLSAEVQAIIVIVVIIIDRVRVAVVRHRLYQVRRFGILAVFHIIQLLVGVVVQRKIRRVRGRKRPRTVVVRRVDGTTLPRTKAQHGSHLAGCCWW